jgi:hypothetical protein
MKNIFTDFELTPQTTLIQGLWIDLGSRVAKDTSWLRIEWLLENRLQLIKHKGREIGSLYRNPQDNHLWHYSLVAPEMGDSSPPSLAQIGETQAEELFGNFKRKSQP